jgi:hypothetical protein
MEVKISEKYEEKTKATKMYQKSRHFSGTG